ncbi:amidohydrolase family protein [Roseitranquillus sediminis]|uniref:amidohydrolase family protein n=1 Tax=Roseitranquillus sediminis TaxID=2809051 RepID=UPI001D0C97CA|nr:amidohydrolase family protein [Roseitranquillus sediminis]MBM9593186.1 amidohydrolase [Roseitranquillus sediminis]
MIVDAHAHLVPPRLLEELQDRKAEFGSVAMTPKDGSLSFAFAGRAPTRPVSPGLTGVDKRLGWMDENGIDRQVIGGWLDMFGNDMPAAEGAEWARTINRHLSAAAEESGGRFIPLAVLPTQDGALAAEVLREAWEMGFRGAMIGTQPDNGGGVLDDASLDPFWQAADALGAIVAIHPVFDAGDDRVKFKGMENAVGRVTDSLIAVSRIIYSGHVEKYARAKILVGIGGAALPYVLGRLKRNHSLHPEDMGDPEKALSMLWYDTLVHDPAALRLLIETVGADRIMLGSDMPFPIGDPTPRTILDEANLDEDARESIEGGLALRLMGE